MMNIVSKLNDWQRIRQTLAGKTIGFIPTMGFLHAGHLQLCKQSVKENDVTIVSVFVNPTQFNQPIDLKLYPRDLDKDVQTLSPLAIDYLFTPDAEEMYPDHFQVQITENSIATELEGQYRPGSFNGMMTVVLKLLNLVQPQRAYFGEKDYQQLLLVKKMVSALFLPVDIIAVPTMRADDQLALSSRNARLSNSEREQAAHFPALLHDTTLDCATIATELTAKGFRVDYIVEKWQRRLGAVWLNDVRLIDNIPLIKERQ